MRLVFSKGYNYIFSQSVPGKKSHNDFNNCEMNLRILRPKIGDDLVINKKEKVKKMFTKYTVQI